MTADRFGNSNSAYSFNGLNNYIRIPNSATLNTSNQLSIAVWVNVNGFYQGTCHGNNILMKGDDDAVSGVYYLRFDDYAITNGQQCSIATPDITHENAFGRGTLNPPGGYTPYVTPNQWTSYVYTYDGTTAKLYVNCQLKMASSAPGLSFNNGYDLFLGRMNHPTYPYWFNGVLDEVRIYDRALNEQEVLTYGGCGYPDLRSSQFFSSLQVAPGAYIDEVIALRNTGNFNTLGPLSFNVTNYSGLTGLTVTQIPPGTGITIGPDTYTMSAGWSFNSGTGTFNSNNVIINGTNNLIGIRISRANSPNQGANGVVTQTTSITAGTGAELIPSQNNSISNTILKY